MIPGLGSFHKIVHWRQVLMGKGLYGEAIVELEKGNSVYNSDTSLLNSLGYCYCQSGQLQKSLDVLQASLKLNPQQKKIQSLINLDNS